MASIDFDALKQPLSDADPCGPDLDLEYDDDYMNFVANIEGLLPTTFFNEGLPFQFDPTVLKVETEIERILGFWERTRDVRLLTLMGRLLVLNRDLDGFSRVIDAIVGLLDAYWDAVHPRAEGGTMAMRAATLGTLDEPTVVFSLQYSRICDSRRTGPVNFRAYLYAMREAEPREGEQTYSESAILQAMREAEEQTLASRESLERLRDAIGRITSLWIERDDMMTAPKLSNVTAIVGRMLALIDMAFPRAGEATATDGAGAIDSDGKPATAGAVTSPATAVAALAAAADYFLQREPSSPILPLVAQAQQLLGKSFIDVLQTLLPDHVGSAAYQIGGRQYFPLPVERLASLLPTPPAYGEPAEATNEEPAEADSSSDDGWGSSWSTSSDDSEAEVAADSENPDASEPMEESASAPEPELEPAAAPKRAAPAGPIKFEANSRAAALGLLDAVAAWLRAEEPSSPVPWLIERARGLADRDFLSVLRSVLPTSALIDLDQE